jgi:hypothetical protein
MIPIYNPEHPHHAVWREYTESLLVDEPVTVQVLDFGVWCDAAENCISGLIAVNYNTGYAYRIKPKEKIVIINGVEYTYPKPFSGKLLHNQEYYILDLANNCVDINRSNFNADRGENHVASGLVHLTANAAKEHLEVMQQILKL